MDEKRGIGIEGKMPWNLPADLRQFKSLTMGHHIIMGRKTYESIGRPLPGRTMVVITRNLAYQAEGCFIAHSLEAAIEKAQKSGEDEVFIIGGGQIFAEAIELADRIYLTLVHTDVPVNIFFPEYPPDDWEEVESDFNPADEKNEYPFTYKILSRKYSLKDLNAKIADKFHPRVDNSSQ
jgi:dihydrofolate reductase